MAHAAVTSLLTTLGLIIQRQYPSLNLFQQEEIESRHEIGKELYQQIEFLRRKVRSLQELLETRDNISDGGAVQSCEAKIKVSAHDAEDRIESILGEIYEAENMKVLVQGYERLCKMLQQVSKSIDSEIQHLEKSMKNCLQETSNSFTKRLELPDQRFPQLQNIMIGHETELDDMKNQLIRQTSSSELQVVAIVGMGGIGKTTFARRVYNDLLIGSYFDIRAWVTMSKEYCIRVMLLQLLNSIMTNNVSCSDEDDEGDIAAKLNNYDEQSDGDLAADLKKKLQRRRYLIIIDDIWSTDAWDDVNQWFPDSEGSHILLTTRCGNVASYAAPGKSPRHMSLLNPNESWDLFQKNILGKEHLSSDFLKIGKKIAYNCQGLPLTIVVVAGLLSKCSNALDRWQQVERNVKSALLEDGNQQCEKVLALSYYYLPQHLKACFLYFAVFPEDTEVPANKLIKLWVAEGFLKDTADKSFEDVAKEYLNELIDRNLVFISRNNFCGKVKTCKIHDLLHEFCLKEAQSENFLCVTVRDDTLRSIRVSPQFTQVVSGKCHRMAVQSINDLNVINSYPFDRKEVRSFVYSGERGCFVYLDMRFNKFKMIRVLDIRNLSIQTRLISLLHLRYLSLTVKYRGEVILSNLQNLQTLVVHIEYDEYSYEPHVTPLEIMSLPQLKNLHSTGSSLLTPPNTSSEHTVLEHLHAITGVGPAWCKKEIFDMMPNMKKLGIQFCGLMDLWKDLPFLSEVEGIEALRIIFKDSYLGALPGRDSRLLDQSIFPPTLKKLTLVRSFLSWKDMDVVAMLPNLEELKLKEHACRSNDHWEPARGGFSQLRLLLLDRIRLTEWKATEENFPMLERLYMSHCHRLKRIPTEFAYISTLQVIELEDCCQHLVASAQEIEQEQEDNLGCKAIQVHVSRINEADVYKLLQTTR